LWLWVVLLLHILKIEKGINNCFSLSLLSSALFLRLTPPYRMKMVKRAENTLKLLLG